MIVHRLFFVLCLGLCMTSIAHGTSEKKRIFVVSSYHKGYLWSESTQKGLSEAMLKYGYLDNTQQSEVLAANDYVESTKAVIKKAWMDTKRKYTLQDLGKTTQVIRQAIEEFRPHLVLRVIQFSKTIPMRASARSGWAAKRRHAAAMLA